MAVIHPDLIVVDENDNVIGHEPFDVVYSKGLHHRISRVIVEDGHGNMLLQKRGPNVHLYPNTWDVAAAGHVDEGEDGYESAALRELAEETGLTGLDLEEMGKVEVHKEVDGHIVNRFAMYFKAIVDKDSALVHPPEEVDELKWFAIDEVMRMWREEPDTLADGLTDGLAKFYTEGK